MNTLRLSNINFSYLNADKALSDINLEINSGEVVLIVGNSGCGKSTLLNILSGMIPEVIEGNLDGKSYLDGKEELKIHERSLLVGSVFQNPRSQFFTTNTTSELVFAMENYATPVHLIKEKLEYISDKFNIRHLLDRDIFSLSSGERQLLALLSALIMDPGFVIFDEPSANLDYGNAMRLRSQIMALKKEGKGVIVADHRYFYLEGIIDRVFLIHDKKIIEYGSEDEFIHSSYGKRVFRLFTHPFSVRKINRGRDESIRLENVSFKSVLKNINTSFRHGEVCFIVGVNGGGKTTFARLVSGILKPTEGQIKLNDKLLYIMQDADFQLFGSSVTKELEITSKDRKKNEDALRLLSLWHLRDKHPQSLSGGEKQRLQLAITLVCDSMIILFDEPTSGLDKASMEKVVNLIERLRKDHTIIIISHDYEFIRSCADRVLYLKDSSFFRDFYLDSENVKTLNDIYREMEEFYE